MKIAIACSPNTDCDMLSQLIQSGSDHEIIWTASCETDFFTSYKEHTPDLLLLDISCSGNPSHCVKDIMKNSPCVILLMTAAVEGNEASIFEAMRWGALDVAIIPESREKEAPCKEFLHKIEIMHTLAESRTPPKKQRSLSPSSLVAIGASTGGPNAIRSILADIPGDFEGHIVIVQHIDAEFLPGMASWLNNNIDLDVQVARDGDTLKKGKVLIAIGPDNLIITEKKKLKYAKPLPDAPFTPSIDIFFKSCAENLKESGVSVILSGMGKDGAEGMKAMRDSGWETIAQDEGTSAIYGMPKEAAVQGAAKHILPIESIARAILEYTHYEYK